MARRRDVPNVVMIVSDQQRADTMPGVRAAKAETPHLEWLAQRSTLFRRSYCTDPVCSPARSSILSGLYAHTTGMVANHQERAISNELRLSRDMRVLADYLKPLGYVCAYTGKWHLGTGGDRRGFDDFVTRSGDYDIDGPEQNEILRFANRVGTEIKGKQLGLDPNPIGYERATQVGSSLLPLAWHPSMQDAVRAARFVRRMERDARPFVLVYSCHEPHQPFVSPRPFDRMYSPDSMPLPETLRDRGGARLLAGRHDLHLKAAADFSDDDLRSMWASYYGAISYVDHLVGTIIAALVETDQFDETLFVFTSDHGEMMTGHGLLFKGAVLYEELINVPLVIKPPQGLRAPHPTDRLVSHVDLVPTIMKWCGADLPDHLQGRDIRQLIEGGDDPVNDGVGLEYHSGNWGERPSPLRGWRTEEWKYVESDKGGEELYDVRSDPHETNNLIADPAAAGAREEMKVALYAWLKRTGDRWPEVPIPPRLVGVEPRTVWKDYA